MKEYAKFLRSLADYIEANESFSVCSVVLDRQPEVKSDFFEIEIVLPSGSMDAQWSEFMCVARSDLEFTAALQKLLSKERK